MGGLNCQPSKRYAAGLSSYGKKVRTDKRKARIIAELNAMGVKPRVRRPMGRRVIKRVGFFGKTGLWRAA